MFLAAAALPSFADSIPYTKVGTVAPTVTTYASGNNGIDIYYYGSTAGFTDTIGVYDVQTQYNSGLILNNKTTAVGTEVVVGSTAGQINAGDQLIFYINSPDGIFASIAADSADGINHAYITSFSGSTLNGVKVPAGIFVGMEDENKSHSDLNYNDDDFIFTNVSAPAVTAEPASILMLGTGLLAGVAFLRRQTSL